MSNEQLQADSSGNVAANSNMPVNPTKKSGGTVGNLKHRELEGFLNKHGFVVIKKKRGEIVYRYSDGQKVSVPPSHSGRQELAPGTACKIVKRMSAIIGKPLKVSRGGIEVLAI